LRDDRSIHQWSANGTSLPDANELTEAVISGSLRCCVPQRPLDRRSHVGLDEIISDSFAHAPEKGVEPTFPG
jgi:hypothetical protein